MYDMVDVKHHTPIDYTRLIGNKIKILCVWYLQENYGHCIIYPVNIIPTTEVHTNWPVRTGMLNC